MKLFYLCQIFREFTVFKIINGLYNRVTATVLGWTVFKPSVFSLPFLHPVIHIILKCI